MATTDGGFSSVCVEKACQKHPISTEQVERVVENVEKAIREISEKERKFFSYSAKNYVNLKDKHLEDLRSQGLI